MSGLIYLVVFAIPFPLIHFYDTAPPVDYTKLTNYSQSGFLAYIFGISALFGFYFWAIRISLPGEPHYGIQLLIGRRSITAIRLVLLASLLFALILVFTYPLTAIDLFIYAIRTRGWALYGLPPLSTPPEALPASDPWLGLAGEWLDAASPYGPLWESLSLGAFYLSAGNFLDHLVTLKIICLLAYFGSSWLIYQTLHDHQPRWALTGTIAFAWNPLVLFESIQNAHNDIIMIFFLLAATWLYGHSLKDKQPGYQPVIEHLMICLFLTFSILIKFVTIIVTPFYLFALILDQSTWPRRIGMLALYSLIILTLVLLAMLPVWPGWEAWAVLEAGSGAGRSLTALLVLGLKDWLGTNLAFDTARSIILMIFAIIYLYYLKQSFIYLQQSSPMSLSFGSAPFDHAQGRQDKSFDSAQDKPFDSAQGRPSHSSASLKVRPSISLSSRLPISPAFFILFWYVLIAAPVFHAWYILWFLPVGVLLLPRQRPLNAAIIFSLTALLIIPYFETIRVWYPVLLKNHFLGHLLGVPLLILPPALALWRRTGPTTDSEVSSVRKM